MADPVESAGEQVAAVTENIIGNAVAAVEQQVEAAEARAEAAEAALEVMTDAARRDALHDELEQLLEEGLEQCRTELLSVVEGLRTELRQACQEIEELRVKMAQSQQVTITEQSIPPQSPETPTPTAETVTTVTVSPETASDAPTPEKPEARANLRRWI